MSDFWLGAFIALAVWGFIGSVTSGILAATRSTVEYDTRNVLINLGGTVLFLLLAVLVYTEVIL